MFTKIAHNVATQAGNGPLQSVSMGHVRDSCDVSAKIARLVEERGWNLDEFARLARLNRLTVRQIVHEGKRRLRNATISACAGALGLSVAELRDLPLQTLLARVRRSGMPACEQALRHAYERATQPALVTWMERNPERALQLSSAELDELLSLQGTGGPLTALGVEHFVDRIDRKRRLLDQVHAIAGTEYLDMLEQFVGLLYEKIQPYRDRSMPTQPRTQ
jgi:hypothetical protein